MYVDNNLIFAGAVSAAGVPSATNVFGNGTTIVSGSFTGGNVIDLGSARDIGEGEELSGRVQVMTAASGGTSMQFNFVIADDAAITSNVTVVGTTGAIPVASLTAGARFVADINPRLLSTGKRYLGLQVVNVGNNTAGAIFSDIGIEIQDGQKFYPSGFTVL